MKDINRLLKDYYYADGSEKYKQGEKWETKHYRENFVDRQRRDAWKDLLTQMNEIRSDNPEIQFSYEQRKMVKNMVYNFDYNIGQFNSEQINLIIIIYIFNWIYERGYNFNKYITSLDLDEEKVVRFIMKYIKGVKNEVTIKKEIYKRCIEGKNEN